jgi:hypothetical protein
VHALFLARRSAELATKPCISGHLRDLASRPGEKCGLETPTGELPKLLGGL